MKSMPLMTLAGLTSQAVAFWRMECNGMAGLSRIDPLVNFGQPSMHVHALFGSSALGLSSTPESLKRANCTSCAVMQDKSGYWQPALYFQHANGSIEYVGIKGDNGKGNAGILVYYKLLNNEGTQGTGVTPFPPGFQMIAGNNMQRKPPVALSMAFSRDPPKSQWRNTPQKVLAWRAIGFNCIDPADRQPEPTLWRHYMPSVAQLRKWNCRGGLRTEIVFPSCWDGKPFEAINTSAHVKYPSLSEDGACPEGFRIRLPTLLYEAIWNTAKFVSLEGRFVLSNGDTTGFGMHADFVNGWDQETLEKAVATCHEESGRIQDCPVFNIQSKEAWETCKLTVPKVLSKEVVSGKMLAALPGNVPITEVVLNPSNDPSEDQQTEPLSIPRPSNSTVKPQKTASVTKPLTNPITAIPNTPTGCCESPPLTTTSDSQDVNITWAPFKTEIQTIGTAIYHIVYEAAVSRTTRDVTTTIYYP